MYTCIHIHVATKEPKRQFFQQQKPQLPPMLLMYTCIQCIRIHVATKGKRQFFQFFLVGL